MTTAAPDGAREVILARVRAALTDVAVGESPDTAVPRSYERHRRVDDPAGLLVSRLSEMGVTVTRCASPEVAATLAGALGDGPVLCAPGFPAAWRPGRADLHDDDPTTTAADIDGFATGLTGCASAIAETGTLILDGGPVSGRRLVSLVPDTHVCVLRASDIEVDLPQAIAALEPTRPLTFVTGPSATVDIELVRTVGVHGPRSLRVVIVDDE